MTFAIPIVFYLIQHVNSDAILPGPLLFFAPFDGENGNKDKTMGNYSIFMDDFCKLETSTTGPFGLVNSSYTISNDEGFIGLYQNIPWTQSFTLFAYTFVADWYKNGGIISTTAFSINYMGNSLEMVRLSNGNAIDNFTINNFFNGWTLICLVYNNENKSVSLFNQNGFEIYQKFDFEIFDWEDSFLLIGGGFRYGSVVTMHEQDAISKVMIYGEMLNSFEIQQIHQFLGKNKTFPTLTIQITAPEIEKLSLFDRLNDTWRKKMVKKRKNEKFDKTFVFSLASVLVLYLIAIVFIISIGLNIHRFSKSSANRNVQGPYRQVLVES